ncbi:MAG: amidohydrolase family protein [Caldimonas sp.]
MNAKQPYLVGYRFAWACAAMLLSTAGHEANAAPELLLVNAKIFTGTPGRSEATAVAIEDHRILAIGSDDAIRKLAGPDTRIIDAGGRLVTPGLIEAHVHLAQNVPTPPLRLPGLPFPGPTGDETLAAVAAAAKTQTTWITAYVGPSVARDQRNWREALDAAAPDTPVFLRGFWGHTSIVNSAGLRSLGIPEDVADPLGGWWGRDAGGRLDGRAYEAAETIGPRIRPATPEFLAQAFGEAEQRYARWGVTSIHLMNSDKSVPMTLAGLARLKPAQKWTVYSWGAWETSPQHIVDAWNVIDAATPHAPPRVRVEGPKWVLDGSPIEQWAFQREAYAGRPGWRGRSDYTDAQLREILQLGLKRPTQLALHAVGDAETDRLLDTMLSIAPGDAWRPKRVRIEHGDGIRPDTLEKVRRLGIVVVQNPTHLALPMIDGRPMIDHPALLKSFLAAGIVLAFGSDGGPAEANPFLNMMLAIQYPGQPAEGLTREQSLAAYTSGAAFAERQENLKGRIAVGMAADLAVLSQDLLTVPLAQFPKTTSLLTIVDGEVIYEDPALVRP